MSLKFDNTDQIMQHPIPKLRQSSIISEKPGYFSETLQILMSSNYQLPQSLLFFAEILHTFPIYQYLKRVLGIFFSLDLDLLIKNVKNECVESRSF